MPTTGRLPACCFSLSLAVFCGCGTLFPNPQFDALKTQNRALGEQNRAQLAEIENLKVHSRNTVEKLNRAEEDLAVLEDEIEANRKQLANYEQERSRLREQFRGVVRSNAHVPVEVSQQLVEISRRHPCLQFDPVTGIAKLDTDILFDSGKSELKTEAGQVLAEMVDVLKLPEGRELKIMIVGHTDDRRMARNSVWMTRGWALPASVHTSRSPRTSRRRVARRTAAWRSSSWHPTCPWSDGPSRSPVSINLAVQLVCVVPHGWVALASRQCRLATLTRLHMLLASVLRGKHVEEALVKLQSHPETPLARRQRHTKEHWRNASGIRPDACFFLRFGRIIG